MPCIKTNQISNVKCTYNDLLYYNRVCGELRKLLTKSSLEHVTVHPRSVQSWRKLALSMLGLTAYLLASPSPPPEPPRIFLAAPESWNKAEPVKMNKCKQAIDKLLPPSVGLTAARPLEWFWTMTSEQVSGSSGYFPSTARSLKNQCIPTWSIKYKALKKRTKRSSEKGDQ